MPVHCHPITRTIRTNPEHAADPNGPALAVIAAAAVPKPAPEQNHDQQDDQN